jgi:outer membrane protein assembly factor BamB
MTSTIHQLAILGLLLFATVGLGETFQEIHGAVAPADELPPIQVAAEDWPWWRGPNRDGIAATQEVPLKFGPKENVRWQIDVPGRGHSSPTLWGDQLFLTTADAERKQQDLLAYDRRNGRKLWSLTLHAGGELEKIHKQNSHASASCACDGQRVFTVFVHDGRLWVSAVSLDGKCLWQTAAGNFNSIYGYGSSPAIHASLVIVCGDNDQGDSYLAALHRRSGEIVWRVQRPKIDTYATPVVARVADRDQLLLGGGGHLVSYDPNYGSELWRCLGPTTETTANTVAFSKEVIFASGGYPKPYTMIAVRADGRGDVTASKLLWSASKRMPYVPSPLYHDGLLYIADDLGLFTCVDAASGKEVWTQRMGGDFTASPVLCGDRIYAANEAGKVFVLQAGRRFKLLASNDLGEGIMATPTIVGGCIFVRTVGKLYCFGEGK